MRCRLYLITPPAFDPDAFAPEFVEALEGGDVACVQLRLKGAADAEIERAAGMLMPLTQAAGAAFLVNDRPDIAARLGADGVHIGQDDASYDEARRLLGPERIIGVTCHNSRHLAMEAAERGADYVAFGAFYPSQTKEPKTRAEPELLSWWSELFEVPCVAIGGITAGNATPLIRAGADFLAVSSGVWNYCHGPGEAVARFNGMFDELADGAVGGTKPDPDRE
jgi:thiamine-phosphate pyrophosphorylase